MRFVWADTVRLASAFLNVQWWEENEPTLTGSCGRSVWTDTPPSWWEWSPWSLSNAAECWPAPCQTLQAPVCAHTHTHSQIQCVIEQHIVTANQGQPDLPSCGLAWCTAQSRGYTCHGWMTTDGWMDGQMESKTKAWFIFHEQELATTRLSLPVDPESSPEPFTCAAQNKQIRINLLRSNGSNKHSDAGG